MFADKTLVAETQQVRSKKHDIDKQWSTLHKSAEKGLATKLGETRVRKQKADLKWRETLQTLHTHTEEAENRKRAREARREDVHVKWEDSVSAKKAQDSAAEQTKTQKSRADQEWATLQKKALVAQEVKHKEVRQQKQQSDQKWATTVKPVLHSHIVSASPNKDHTNQKWDDITRQAQVNQDKQVRQVLQQTQQQKRRSDLQWQHMTRPREAAHMVLHDPPPPPLPSPPPQEPLPFPPKKLGSENTLRDQLREKPKSFDILPLRQILNKTDPVKTSGVDGLEKAQKSNRSKAQGGSVTDDVIDNRSKRQKEALKHSTLPPPDRIVDDLFEIEQKQKATRSRAQGAGKVSDGVIDNLLEVSKSRKEVPAQLQTSLPPPDRIVDGLFEIEQKQKATGSRAQGAGKVSDGVIDNLLEVSKSRKEAPGFLQSFLPPPDRIVDDLFEIEQKQKATKSKAQAAENVTDGVIDNLLEVSKRQKEIPVQVQASLPPPDRIVDGLFEIEGKRKSTRSKPSSGLVTDGVIDNLLEVSKRQKEAHAQPQTVLPPPDRIVDGLFEIEGKSGKRKLKKGGAEKVSDGVIDNLFEVNKRKSERPAVMPEQYREEFLNDLFEVISGDKGVASQRPWHGPVPDGVIDNLFEVPQSRTEIKRPPPPPTKEPEKETLPEPRTYRSFFTYSFIAFILIILIGFALKLLLDYINLNYIGARTSYMAVKAASTKPMLFEIEKAVHSSDTRFFDVFVLDSIPIAYGQRFLLKDELNPQDNGIFIAFPGKVQRAQDMNSFHKIVPGNQVYVGEGNTFGGVSFMLFSLEDKSEVRYFDQATGYGITFQEVTNATEVAIPPYSAFVNNTAVTAPPTSGVSLLTGNLLTNQGNGLVALSPGAVGTVLTATTGGLLSWTYAASGGGLTTASLSYQTASGGAPDFPTSSAANTTVQRYLSGGASVVTDPTNLLSLETTQSFTLAKLGIYRVRISCPAGNSSVTSNNIVKVNLYNATTNTTFPGPTTVVTTNTTVNCTCIVDFTITETCEFFVNHFSSVLGATYGQVAGLSGINEVYTVVEIFYILAE